MRFQGHLLALFVVLACSNQLASAWQSRSELQATIELTAREYLKQSFAQAQSFARDTSEVAKRQVSQVATALLSSPPAPAEGAGPPKGTATDAQIQQLCQKLLKQFGNEIVIPKPAIVNKQYEDSRTHVFNAAQAT